MPPKNIAVRISQTVFNMLSIPPLDNNSSSCAWPVVEVYPFAAVSQICLMAESAAESVPSAAVMAIWVIMPTIAAVTEPASKATRAGRFNTASPRVTATGRISQAERLKFCSIAVEIETI